MLDYNDAAPQATTLEVDRNFIRQALLQQLPSVLATLFPAGKVRYGKFHIGDVTGSAGQSLEIVMDGERAGLWTDRATGDGGDIFDLIAAVYGLNTQHDFAQVLEQSASLIGHVAVTNVPVQIPRNTPPTDDLGPVTAKWDYFDAQNKLIAVVYRYDPPGEKKQFRPWDPKRRKMVAPDPRPLYNQPGMLTTQDVVLVEGEKCAQALIEAGIVATTAMNGAKAPIHKTDWSPLKGKNVLIWPDNDEPGVEYATAAAQAALSAGAQTARVLLVSSDRPQGWDAADAIEQGMDVKSFIANGAKMDIQADIANSDDGHAIPDTEDHLALSFSNHYEQDWRYVASWGKWMLWDGRRWQTDDTLLVRHLVRLICRAAAVQAGTGRSATRLAAQSTIGAVESLARTDRRHAATTQQWDSDLWLLNTPAGVVNLKTGTLREHARTDHMTKITTGSPRGDAPLWRAFLNDVTGGDQELQNYLQRVVGYCLTGSTEAHALFFLYGTGANGKSVFVNVINTLLGDYAANAAMDTFMDVRGDRHPTDLAGLRGARMVASTETEQGRRWNESKLKAITGGDKVSARFMRQDFFEYAPQFKLVIAGNHKPSIRNVDEAMRRRLHLIPFTVTVPAEKRDGQLTEKLLAERDGIMAWAVQGCLDWQQHGLQPPAVVTAATDEYFEAEDAMGQWIEERCYVDRRYRETVADLYTDWREWAEQSGEYAGSIKRFSELLYLKNFDRCRFSGGGRGFAGIGLRPSEKQQFTPYIDD